MPNAFAAFAKYAVDPVPAVPTVPTPEEQRAAQGQRELGRIGVAALGVGAGLAGLKGLYNLVRRHTTAPPRRRYPAAITTDVPVPVEAEKLAADKAAEHTSTWTFPWYLPGAAVLGGAGAVAGWKGVDALFNAQRENSKKRETDEAKQQFEQALLSAYPSPRPAGTLPALSDGQKLGAALDALYDRLTETKAAATWDDWVGGTQGLYGAYALATGVPAAMWAYNKGVGGSRRSVLNKAIKLRDRRNYLSRPPEVYAVPRAVPTVPALAEPDEEGVAA